MKRIFILGMSLGWMFGPISAMAQTVTTYKYDALGRLITSTVTGPSPAPIETSIDHDPAGNRTNYKVTGASTSAGSGGSSGSESGGSGGSGSGGTTTTRKVVVVPLNGFTIIPIG